MNKYILLIIVVFVARLSSSVYAQTNSAGESGDIIDLDGRSCTVLLIQDIELPALESGQLTDVFVKPGDNVVVDKIVAQMDDTRSRRAFDEATFRFQIAEERANDVIEINAAYKRYELAYNEHKKMQKLRVSGSMSEQQAERAKVSAELAQLEYQSAKKSQQLSAIESAAEQVTVQASQDSINRHAMKAPINGQVYEVLREAGEWVTAGETIMKIARMDRLRISTLIDGNQYNPHEIANRPVQVTLQLPQGQSVEFEGSVVYVGNDRGLRNEFAVWAEVDNRTYSGHEQHWILNPGHSVSMKILLNQPPVITSTAQNQLLGSDQNK